MTTRIVPPGPRPPDAYERELILRLEALRSRHADELAKLGWWARHRREQELRRWVETELSCLVRAGRLPAKRDARRRWLDLFFSGEPPVLR
jgi:hypothetical protein